MTLRVHRSIADVTAEQWQACLQADHPFLNHAFLAALESSGSVGGETGWVPFHLALWDQGELLACAPAFLKTHSYGEYVFDWLWAETYEQAGGRYYPKLLFGVPFTPVPGPRLLVSSRGATRLGAATARRHLVQGAQELLKHYGLSSCHALFLREAADREAFAQIGALPRFGLQYHWHGRDDCPDWASYLARMRAPKRKQIKRERTPWTAYRFAWRTGRELQDPTALATFYEHYASTYDRKWGAPYLRPAFFETLFRTLPEAVQCLCCFHDGVWCASALNYISWEEKALFGRHWGCAPDQNSQSLQSSAQAQRPAFRVLLLSGSRFRVPSRSRPA